MSKCTGCKKEHSGLTKNCDECKTYSRSWNKKNKAQKREANLRWYANINGKQYYRNYFNMHRKRHADTIRKYKYGMEPGTYNMMLEAQGGVCAIEGCSVVENLCVDHNHETGKVRALLCRGCNAAIGHLKESAEKAESIAAYIRKHAQ